MLCHRGPLSALAVDITGHHMVTAGVDNQVKVWDIRMMRPMHAYFSHSTASSLEISQRGLLAVGYGRKVQVGGAQARMAALVSDLGHYLEDCMYSTALKCTVKSLIACFTPLSPLNPPLPPDLEGRPTLKAAGPLYEPLTRRWRPR